MRYKGQILEINGGKVKQVNKTVARKAFDKGKKVYLLPCFLSFYNILSPPTCFIADGSCTFDMVVNSFEYYNCIGDYSNFFVEVES